ncbi:MAG: hypothetical protein J2P20_13850 [Pseudonocardia sp.]|nr:hypothetical protein [Pseudonocardia sp.]
MTPLQFLAATFTLLSRHSGAAMLMWLSAKLLLGVLAVLSAARAVLQAVWELGGPQPWHRADGALALVIAPLGVYLAAAFLLKYVRAGTLLPIGRRGQPRRAVQPHDSESQQSFASEPGVRPQL